MRTIKRYQRYLTRLEQQASTENERLRLKAEYDAAREKIENSLSWRTKAHLGVLEFFEEGEGFHLKKRVVYSKEEARLAHMIELEKEYREQEQGHLSTLLEEKADIEQATPALDRIARKKEAENRKLQADINDFVLHAGTQVHDYNVWHDKLKHCDLDQKRILQELRKTIEFSKSVFKLDPVQKNNSHAMDHIIDMLNVWTPATVSLIEDHTTQTQVHGHQESDKSGRSRSSSSSTNKN
jgi:hypothetical protein